MQTAGCIYQHHIHIIGYSTVQRIVSHAGRITTHILLHHGNAYPFAPDNQLFYGSSTEGIGSTKHHLVASLLKLVGQLTNGGSLTHTIHTHHHNNVWFFTFREFKSLGIIGIIFCQQLRDLIAQDVIQFAGRNILVSGHTLLYTLYNIQCGLYAHITGHQHLLQVIQDIIIHLGFTCNGS